MAVSIAIGVLVMTYRGRVVKGVVVFDGESPLKDGTVVSVEPIEASITRPLKSSREAVLAFNSFWEGPPGEMQRLLEAVQAARDNDLTPLNDDVK